MRTQTEADKTFLDLVQGSLQASAKEAERIAKLTETQLVRIDSAEPVAPKELLPLLNAWNISTHNGTGKKA